MNLTCERLLPSSSAPCWKVYFFLGVSCYADMNSWCFRLCASGVCMCVPASSTYWAHTQGNILQEAPCSQSKSILLGPTFSLVARGPAAELLSERAKASCFHFLIYSLMVGESPLLMEQCSVLSQPVSSPTDPSNMERKTSQPSPRLSCILVLHTLF